ncbi:MAG: NACHT domain-containing protein [Planctomycetaceae bacterium]|nr:NACHT domain-containing protein [Planctomycetaceae bacterium]
MRHRIAPTLKEPTMTQAFLIEQPIWQLNEPNPELRWEMGVVEDDPSEDDEHRPRKGVHILHERQRQRGEDAPPDKIPWTRLSRDTLVAGVLSDDARVADRPWHRVALVSGAGLGKTANLQWLASQVNAHEDSRGRLLAIFTHLRNLPAGPEPSQQLPEFVKHVLQERADDRHKDRLAELALRLLKQGRVLFLLDSLDEAGAWEDSPTMNKLKPLLSGHWKDNPVWISGRPYAFRATEKVLCEMVPTAQWNFLRIGPLNEPEARQLIETAGRV